MADESAASTRLRCWSEGDGNEVGFGLARNRLRKFRRRWAEVVLGRAAAVLARRHQADFASVDTYCAFLGYPRSGHSLFGALIDAHPNAIISHELDALRYVEAGVSRNQLFGLILANSQKFAAEGRKWTGYDYSVPDQWQGRFRALKVIGDKRGGATVARLRDQPESLDRLMLTVGVPVRFIHVVRNPFDNVSTMSLRNPHELADNVERYLRLSKGVEEIKRNLPPETVLDVRQERFLEDPETRLREICSFLGLEPADSYIRDCADIVFRSPHRSRIEVEWTPPLIERVEEVIDRVPFLEGYRFDE